MTILDYCISLKTNKNFLVVLGVVDMRQLLLKIRYFVHKLFNEVFPSTYKSLKLNIYLALQSKHFFSQFCSAPSNPICIRYLAVVVCTIGCETHIRIAVLDSSWIGEGRCNFMSWKKYVGKAPNYWSLSVQFLNVLFFIEREWKLLIYSLTLWLATLDKING